MPAAFIFPGQGSQALGVGKALAETFPAARAVFDEVDGALGEKLSRTMWDGPAEALTLTENAQPALMAVSLAAMRVLEGEAGLSLARDAKFVAGHSLGEYSALAAARAFALADAARLLRIRGKAMQAAVPAGEGAMAAQRRQHEGTVLLTHKLRARLHQHFPFPPAFTRCNTCPSKASVTPSFKALLNHVDSLKKF